MKLSQAKKILEVKAAVESGIQCEWLTCGKWKPISEWSETDWEIVFKNGNELRIKPEPKLRPWKPEEVPVGARIRSIDALECGGRIINGMIVYVLDQNRLGYCDTTGQREWNFDGALECLEYSIDGGKTWKPCGIQE